MLRFTRMMALAAMVLLYHPPGDFSSRSGGSLPAGVPDFGNRTVWKPLPEQSVLNLEEGMPWSISHFYSRLDDPAVMGMEIALLWDTNPIYKLWRHKAESRQALRIGASKWTAPLIGAKVELIFRTDWVARKIVGVVMLVYEDNAQRPSAYQSFNDPAEQEEEAPSVSGKF